MKKKIVLGITLFIGIALLTTGCKAKLKNGEEVAVSVNGKNITADDLYKELKLRYAKDIIADQIDKKIFDKKYKNDEEIEKQTNNYVEYVKSTYSDDFEDTLVKSGFIDEDDFINNTRLNYQRQKAIEEYIKDNITDKEIKDYYNDEFAGDISAKHILIKVKSDSDEEGLTDDEAKAKAEDLIKELNDGADFSTLAKENSEDPGSAANGGDLGYFNKGKMVKEFEEAAYKLKVNEYTSEPVKTTYGYHIILKTDEKEKESLDKVKDEIKEKIVDKKREDKVNDVKVLDKIRKENKMKFKDSKLKSLYEEYLEKEIENAKSSN